MLELRHFEEFVLDLDNNPKRTEFLDVAGFFLHQFFFYDYLYIIFISIHSISPYKHIILSLNCFDFSLLSPFFLLSLLITFPFFRLPLLI